MISTHACVHLEWAWIPGSDRDRVEKNMKWSCKGKNKQKTGRGWYHAGVITAVIVKDAIESYLWHKV